jgi:hypothetical protein
MGKHEQQEDNRFRYRRAARRAMHPFTHVAALVVLHTESGTGEVRPGRTTAAIDRAVTRARRARPGQLRKLVPARMPAVPSQRRSLRRGQLR